MGRPVQKRKFGNPSTTTGNQFYVLADVGNGIEQCYIIKQTGTLRFKCKSVALGTELSVKLVDGPVAVTGPGFGYMEAGLASATTTEAELASVTVGGSGYSIADTVTVTAGTGTDPIFDIDSVIPVDAQDETNYDNVGTNGTFAGGTGHNNGDILVMNDGTTITADLTAGNVITEFTVDNSTTTSAQVADDVVLTQASSDGSGINFTLTLDDANQAISIVSVNTAGSLTVEASNPAATSSTGAGTGATLTVIYSSTTDEYVKKLSNKNLRVTSSVSDRRDTYTINSENANAKRDVAGE